MQTHSDFMTIDGLAEMLKVNTDTVYQWRARKMGPPSVKIGATVRYRRSTVLAWLADQENASTRKSA